MAMLPAPCLHAAYSCLHEGSRRRVREAPVLSPLQNDSGSVPVGRDAWIMPEGAGVGTKSAEKFCNMSDFKGLAGVTAGIKPADYLARTSNANFTVQHVHA